MKPCDSSSQDIIKDLTNILSLLLNKKKQCKYLYQDMWLRWFPQLNIHTHKITTVRKTLGEIDAQGKLQPDGTFIMYVKSNQM